MSLDTYRARVEGNNLFEVANHEIFKLGQRYWQLKLRKPDGHGKQLEIIRRPVSAALKSSKDGVPYSTFKSANFF